MGSSNLSVISEDGHAGIVAAISMGWPKQVFDKLNRGVPANNDLGNHSYIAFAMHNYLAHPSPARAQVAEHLLAYGARLDHRPLDANDRPGANGLPRLWADTEFGITIMFGALSYALQHELPLPRLRTGDMPFDAQLLADAEHTRLHFENPTLGPDAFAEHRNLPKIYAALTAVGAVQDEVALRLNVPGNETEKFVSDNLPESERSFWRKPASDPLGRALRLRV